MRGPSLRSGWQAWETREELKVRRLALQKLPAPDLTGELSITSRDLSAHGDDMRPTFDFHPFEGVIVEVHQVRFRCDGAAVVRIVDHEVRIAAELDCTFPREQPKDLRSIRAGRRNKLWRSMRPRFTPCVK